jgi:hypothetical protein
MHQQQQQQQQQHVQQPQRHNQQHPGAANVNNIRNEYAGHHDMEQHQVDDQLSGIMEQHQHHHRRRAPSKLDDDDVNIDEVDHLHGDMLHPATDGGDFMNVEYGDH